jgi:hypothetical protein
MSDLKAMEPKSDEVLKTPEVEKQELTAEELSQLSGGTGGHPGLPGAQQNHNQSCILVG